MTGGLGPRVRCSDKDVWMVSMLVFVSSRQGVCPDNDIQSGGSGSVHSGTHHITCHHITCHSAPIKATYVTFFLTSGFTFLTHGTQWEP